MRLTREDRRWFGLGFGLGWLLVALLLSWVLTSSCTSTQRQTLKSHAAEDSVAVIGGILIVIVGGPAAIPILVGTYGTAAYVGELNRPPPQTEHTTTVVDEKGKILSQKTTTSTPSAPHAAMDSILSWIENRTLIILALVLLAVFPATREIALQALSALGRAVQAAPAWIGSHLKSVVTQKRPERRKRSPGPGS